LLWRESEPLEFFIVFAGKSKGLLCGGVAAMTRGPQAAAAL
jgi:hypothetical protein